MIFSIQFVSKVESIQFVIKVESQYPRRLHSYSKDDESIDWGVLACREEDIAALVIVFQVFVSSVFDAFVWLERGGFQL